MHAAPLRETLAAAALLLAGWPNDSLGLANTAPVAAGLAGAQGPITLADPMCGSGTIAIEVSPFRKCTSFFNFSPNSIKS